MSEHLATARSCSNIALIKYWGDRDNDLRLPANGSISMTLAGLETITTVRFSAEVLKDQLTLNGELQTTAQCRRVSQHLDHIRHLAGTTAQAQVISRNNFPMGTGIASSASAFAALTVAACAALDLQLDEAGLSALARLGSGSACRSIPGGYVEWYAGTDHHTSYAASFAPANHWELIDLVAVVSREHKSVDSTSGHRLAITSPLQATRVADTPRRLELCRSAILHRDFEALADIIEHDAFTMHAVMLTSRPALIYWLPATLRIIRAVRDWRAAGISVAFTIDAGPNVHVISTRDHQETLTRQLSGLEGIQDVLPAAAGEPTRLIDEHLGASIL